MHAVAAESMKGWEDGILQVLIWCTKCTQISQNMLSRGMPVPPEKLINTVSVTRYNLVCE